ncbi:MAG: imidazolonepropionase [Pseudomonadota bacterium]
MLFTNVNLVTMDDPTSYGIKENCAIAVSDGKIEWVGPKGEVPNAFDGFQVHDFEGRLLTPGLIDCHTHLVFGGNRAQEFEMRLEGASYEDIARSGGGIVSTVTATRNADEADLLADAQNRVDALIQEGVTTIEVKSGYGLDVETELKMLRVARRLGETREVRVLTSFLGAHAIPKSHTGKPEDYILEVCIPALEAAYAENLVDAVDGFCEGIAFSTDEIRPVFEKAVHLGLPVKLHAEQLSNLGGAVLASEYGAISVDHLEYLDSVGVDAMAKAGSVAVMLPGAFYTLKETQLPPIDLFRKSDVPMAVATDCNPGSSPLASILLAMNMACTLFSMTPHEGLAGVTRNAAKALGLKDRGIVKPGKLADFCVWDIDHPAELSYRIGFNPLHKRIFGGLL